MIFTFENLIVSQISTNETYYYQTEGDWDMSTDTLNLLDHVLAEQKFRSATEAVSYVQAKQSDSDILEMSDLLWMKQEADKQFRNGMTIALFMTKEETSDETF
jgi:hypothetical protein